MNKPKTSAEYFPHYAAQKKTIPILKAKFGSNGYAFWYQLLEMLCAAKGHFLDCSAPGDLDFLSVQMGIPVTEIELILRELLFRGKLDRELWETSRILWCQNLVDNLSPVYSKRKSVPEKPKPLPKSNLRQQFRDGINENVTDYPGSKVKEIKEKEIILKDKGSVENPTPPAPRAKPTPKEFPEIVGTLCTQLEGLIKNTDPKFKPKSMTAWLTEMDRLLRLDNRDAKEVAEVINFSQADQFWSANILSPGNLREKYPQLLAKMKRGGGNGSAKHSPGNDPRQNWRQRENLADFDNIKVTTIISGGPEQPSEPEPSGGNDDVI